MVMPRVPSVDGRVVRGAGAPRSDKIEARKPWYMSCRSDRFETYDRAVVVDKAVSCLCR